MKPSPTNRLLSAALVATGFALSLCFSQAASLSWDGSDTVTAGAQGGSGTWDTNNTANWWDGSTNVVWPSVSSGNDDAVFANTNGTVTLSGAVTVNDMTIGTAGYTLTGGTLNFDGATPTITTLAGDTTISSGITGSNGLTKDGAGTLRFFNNNGGFSNLTYTGVTNVNAGTLTYDFGSAGGNTLSMGSTSGIAIASGATVELSNTQIGTDGAILGTGVPGGMFTGTGTLKKTGAGYLGVSWSGANDTLSAFNGTIQVAQGTLGVNRGSGSTAGNGKATLQIDSGATVDVRTGIFAVDALNGAGTVIASFGGGNTLSLGNNNGSGSFAGSLQGGLALIKNGTGTQTLTNASSFTGGTTVNAGTLAYQFSSRPGWNHNSFNTANIGNVAVASGATLELNSVDNTTENANFSSGIFSGAGTISKTGAGQISFNAGSSINTFTGQINVVNGTLQTNGSNWNTAGIGTGQMSMNISSGAAFDIRTGGIRIDRLTGFGRVTVSHTAGGSLSVGNNNGSSLFSGIIQNGGSAPSLTKNGTGIFTLAGANTFTGTTTIAGGTLAIGASGSINSSAVTVQNTATLQTNAVGKTMAGLTLQDGSTLTLAAANGSTSITAPLTLSATPNFTVKPIFSALPTAGNITLVSSSSAPGAAGTITTDFSTFGATRVTGSTALSGNDLVLTITTGAANLIWNNAGANSTWDHNTSSNFNNGGSDDKFMSFDAVTFDDTATAGVVTLTGTLASSALTVNTANTYTFAGSGSIAGAGTLTKQGAGTLVLNTANTYSGNTTITAGTLTIGGAGTLGTGAVYGGAISNAGTLNYASSSNQTLAGVISGSGGLTMSGSGTLTLNNAQSNTYTGNTTVNAGTLVEKTSNTGGWTRSSNNTSINNGGTLQLDMSSQVANLQPNNIKAITVNSGGTLELKGSINFIDGSYINAGSVTGAVTIVKSGIGVVQFHNGSSIKDFSGQINVTQGTLATNGSDWNISAGLMSMDISSGASFDIRTGGIVINNLTGLGTIGSSHNGAVTLSVGNNHGSSTFGGVIRNGGGPPGGISTGVPSLTKNGTGTFTLTGANTYTGTTTVAAGTLQLANANAIQNSALVVNTGGATATLNLRADTDTTFAAASVAFNAWTANTIVNVDQATAGNSNHILGFAATSLTQNSGTFTVNGGNGYSLSLGNLTNGNGGNSNPTIIANANVLINTYTDAGNRNLVLNGTATGSTLGAFTATGAGSASLLSKQGTGTWTLTGTNTYTGSTTVTAGTLRVNGSTHASSAVSVASGATLGGAGTIGGVVNVSGVLAPGASIESLVTGSVTLNDLSTLAVEIQDATTVGADLLAINGNLTLDGTVTLDLAKLGAAIWTAGDKLTLASYTGTWDGGLFTYNSNELSDGEQFSFDGTNWVLDYNDTIEGGNFTTDSTGTYLTMTVVPEPAAALLGSLGLLALLRRRR